MRNVRTPFYFNCSDKATHIECHRCAALTREVKITAVEIEDARKERNRTWHALEEAQTVSEIVLWAPANGVDIAALDLEHSIPRRCQRLEKLWLTLLLVVL